MRRSMNDLKTVISIGSIDYLEIQCYVETQWYRGCSFKRDSQVCIIEFFFVVEPQFNSTFSKLLSFDWLKPLMR